MTDSINLLFRGTCFLVLCHVIFYLEALRKHLSALPSVRASGLRGETGFLTTEDPGPVAVFSLHRETGTRQGFRAPRQHVIFEYHFFPSQFQDLTPNEMLDFNKVTF